MRTSCDLSVGSPRFRARAPFDPSHLFAGGAKGVWLDPSAAGALWADTAGTTAVMANGAVALATDRSGSGNHLLQATAADRPQLLLDTAGRRCLAFNGVNHGLRVASIAAASAEVQCLVALKKENDSSVAVLAEFGVFLPAGAFYLTAPHTVGPSVGAALRGTTQRTLGSSGAASAAPGFMVVSVQGNTSGPLSLRVNGVEMARTTQSAGGGVLGNWPLDLGRRGNGTLPFRGRVYGMILRFGPALSSHQMWMTERWLGQKMGLVI